MMELKLTWSSLGAQPCGMQQVNSTFKYKVAASDSLS